MGLISCHAGGIYEHLAAVMSYETLCLALYDQPDLVAAVAALTLTLSTLAAVLPARAAARVHPLQVLRKV